MRSQRSDRSEWHSALVLLAASAAVAVWFRGQVVAAEAELARREQQLELLEKWTPADGGDPRALAAAVALLCAPGEAAADAAEAAGARR
jgi:hypothetical protein